MNSDSTRASHSICWPSPKIRINSRIVSPTTRPTESAISLRHSYSMRYESSFRCVLSSPCKRVCVTVPSYKPFTMLCMNTYSAIDKTGLFGIRIMEAGRRIIAGINAARNAFWCDVWRIFLYIKTVIIAITDDNDVKKPTSMLESVLRYKHICDMTRYAELQITNPRTNWIANSFRIDSCFIIMSYICEALCPLTGPVCFFVGLKQSDSSNCMREIPKIINATRV